MILSFHHDLPPLKYSTHSTYDAMNIKEAYLVSYNLGCMLGWALGLLLGVKSLLATGDLTTVWTAAAPALLPAQWAMCMEIVHAVTGAVRSPVVPTFLQVLSRIVVVVIIALAPSVETTQLCGVMALSWSLVEVARYAFYLNGLLGPGGQAGTLYPVFWLRYSLFAILYPTGISGELGTMVASLADPAFKDVLGGIAVVLVKLVLASYVPGAPFMYMNMVKNRKGAFKKRFAPPPQPPKAPVGTEFPLDSKGGCAPHPPPAPFASLLAQPAARSNSSAITHARRRSAACCCPPCAQIDPPLYRPLSTGARPRKQGNRSSLQP